MSRGGLNCCWVGDNFLAITKKCFEVGGYVQRWAGAADCYRIFLSGPPCGYHNPALPGVRRWIPTPSTTVDMQAKRPAQEFYYWNCNNRLALPSHLEPLFFSLLISLRISAFEGPSLLLTCKQSDVCTCYFFFGWQVQQLLP